MFIIRKKGIKELIAAMICVCLFVAMSSNAFAVQTARRVGNYDTTTYAGHNAHNGIGSFEAVKRSGAAAITGSCNITVYAMNSSGTVLNSAPGSGEFSCSAQAYTSQTVTAGATTSYFVGTYVAYVTE